MARLTALALVAVAFVPALCSPVAAVSAAPVAERVPPSACSVVLCSIRLCGVLACEDGGPIPVDLHQFQQDGGADGDASDTCYGPDPILGVPFDTGGLLDAFTGDVEDNYDARVFTPTGTHVRVELEVMDDVHTLGVLNNALRDLDLYVYRWTGIGCGTLVAQSVGSSFDKSVTFSRGGATRFTVRVVDNGLSLPFGSVCGSCSDAATEPQERTACAPGCSTVHRVVGYRLAAYQLA